MEWQPIETAPRGVWFLAIERWNNVNNYYACKYDTEDDDGQRYYSAACGQYVTVEPEPTHWMPLPPPPTELHRHAGITAASFDSAVDVSLEKNPINS